MNPFAQSQQQVAMSPTVDIINNIVPSSHNMMPSAQSMSSGAQSTGPNKSFCDSKTDGLHADPRDCASYIHCVGGIDYRTTCPGGTAFDEKYGVCDYTKNVKRCKRPPGIVG